MSRFAKLLISLCLCIGMMACTAEPVWAPDEDVAKRRYINTGQSALTLITVINTRSGGGAHTGLLIDADERVLWDPAGTWWNPISPERNDLHYGMSPALVDNYIDYHTRETHYTVTQRIAVPRAVAIRAKNLASKQGAASQATCTHTTSSILRQLPGFETMPNVYLPKKLMEEFANLPNVETRKFVDDDPADNSDKLTQK